MDWVLIEKKGVVVYEWLECMLSFESMVFFPYWKAKRKMQRLTDAPSKPRWNIPGARDCLALDADLVPYSVVIAPQDL